jgi:hypothetical protein
MLIKVKIILNYAVSAEKIFVENVIKKEKAEKVSDINLKKQTIILMVADMFAIVGSAFQMNHKAKITASKKIIRSIQFIRDTMIINVELRVVLKKLITSVWICVCNILSHVKEHIWEGNAI